MFQLRTEKMTSLEAKEGPFVCLHLTADFGEDVTGLNIFRMPQTNILDISAFKVQHGTIFQSQPSIFEDSIMSLAKLPLPSQ